MEIFGAHITGSLSVSGSSEILNDLIISGNFILNGTSSVLISGSLERVLTQTDYNTFSSSLGDITTILDSINGEVI